MASSGWSKADDDQEKSLAAGVSHKLLSIRLRRAAGSRAPRTAPQTGEAAPSAQPSAGDWCDEGDSGPEGEEEGGRRTANSRVDNNKDIRLYILRQADDCRRSVSFE